MDRQSRRHGLCVCQIMPVVSPAQIEPGSDPTGSRCHAVEDGPVNVLVDDLSVGHPVVPTHHTNMKPEPSTGYGAKSRIVQ